VLYQLPGLEELQDLAHEPVSDDEEMASGDVGLPETQGSDLPSPIAHEEQMAAIPEIETPGRWSKRRAESVDESSLERAKRMKAA
jgi:hypothetical protein